MDALGDTIGSGSAVADGAVDGVTGLVAATDAGAGEGGEAAHAASAAMARNANVDRRSVDFIDYTIRRTVTPVLRGPSPLLDNNS